MKKLGAFVTLIRLPNLIFIFLTQWLCYIFLVKKYIISVQLIPTLKIHEVFLLALSTVFIAAAGYIINDYFDIGTDIINKPQKVTVEKIFKSKSVILWHIFFNAIGLGIVAYIAISHFLLRYILIQIVCVALLILYSAIFKRKLIVGNLTIAILNALTLIVNMIYEPQFPLFDFSQKYTLLMWLYIVFAFLITAIREIVKDIEDVKGDTALNCTTIPLVWGINTAKKIIYFLFFIMLILLLLFSYFLYSTQPFWVLFQCIAVFAPSVFVLKTLYTSTHSHDFHKCSTYIKWITFAGILSMILIK